jgi:Acetoacetate decarboxylase (ADC)
MAIPKRIQDYEGRYALVDGIPFQMPINCTNSPVLMAVFTIDADKARRLMPGNEVHPLRLWKRGLLVITVINYLETDIGKYIEFSIAIACTHGAKPAPRFLPAIFQKSFGVGQCVFDLPVSTEISVKGGKGIWGMPKHQANLNYIVGEKTVSSQYDLDGQLAMKIEIERPKSAWLPMSMAAANYSAFRGLLVKSYVHFKGKAGFSLRKQGAAKLTIGTHPRVQPLKELDISPEPFATAFIPQANGVLDDYFESWFLTNAKPPAEKPEGFESVINLALGQQWLEPPKDRPETRNP